MKKIVLITAGLFLSGCAAEKAVHRTDLETIKPAPSVFCEHRAAPLKNGGMFQMSSGNIKFIGSCDKKNLNDSHLVLVFIGDAEPYLLDELEFFLHPENFYTAKEIGEMDCLPNSDCMNSRLEEERKRAELARFMKEGREQLKGGVAVHFKSGQSEPLDVDLLRALAAAANGNSMTLVVVGHTDEVGTNEFNEKLGLRRAERVKELLAKYGIDSSKVKVVSKGELTPVASNKTKDGRSKNRRAIVKEDVNVDAN